MTSTIKWTFIERFPDALIGTPVLLYNEDWIGDYEPDGIVIGFKEHGDKFIAPFWNNYQDLFDTKECKPTHWAVIPSFPGEY